MVQQPKIFVNKLENIGLIILWSFLPTFYKHPFQKHGHKLSDWKIIMEQKLERTGFIR